MSFKNGNSILFHLNRQMAASPFAHGQEQEPDGSVRRAVILFFFSFRTDCVALEVWGTSGMKLWAGKLIMLPCMVELVNTKLSPKLILPWGRKASQTPHLSLSFCLGRGGLWFLLV